MIYLVTTSSHLASRKGGEKETVRERERDRDKQRQRERETEREGHRERERDTERERERETERQRDRQRQTDRQTERGTERERGRQTDRQTDREIEDCDIDIFGTSHTTSEPVETPLRKFSKSTLKTLKKTMSLYLQQSVLVDESAPGDVDEESVGLHAGEGLAVEQVMVVSADGASGHNHVGGRQQVFERHEVSPYLQQEREREGGGEGGKERGRVEEKKRGREREKEGRRERDRERQRDR